MPKHRVGVSFEGTLFPGRLRTTDRRDLDRLLAHPAIPGAVGGLIRLLPLADIAVYPLWPARGRAAFISRWLKRRLAEHPDVKEHPDQDRTRDAVMAALEIADRRPDDLDCWIECPAAVVAPGEALAWALVAAAAERGWALDRLTP
jgi:hypothetical protein